MHGIPQQIFDSMRGCTLADGRHLALPAGHPQVALAKEALQIICAEFQPRHSLTLSSVQPDGSMRYTLYEMWPSHVSTRVGFTLNPKSRFLQAQDVLCWSLAGLLVISVPVFQCHAD